MAKQSKAKKKRGRPLSAANRQAKDAWSMQGKKDMACNMLIRYAHSIAIEMDHDSTDVGMAAELLTTAGEFLQSDDGSM